MTPEQFVYWLQGFVEISGKKELDAAQMQIVQDHLDLVLTKVTPERRPKENRMCKKKDTSLSPELEQLLKEAQEELLKPPSQRKGKWYKRWERPQFQIEPKPVLRCSGGELDSLRTYC